MIPHSYARYRANSLVSRPLRGSRTIPLKAERSGPARRRRHLGSGAIPLESPIRPEKTGPIPLVFLAMSSLWHGYCRARFGTAFASISNWAKQNFTIGN
jgi:hypothetical protein